MIFQATFRRFLAQFPALSDFGNHMLTMAFEAGENAVLGEQQVPALLKQPVLQVVDTDSAAPLTQAQINYLLKVSAHLASEFQEQHSELKQAEQLAWSLSDKSTFVGQCAFAHLNAVRNAKRKLKKHRDRVNGIIVALKKAR